MLNVSMVVSLAADTSATPRAVRSLFAESFDAFTIVLLICSLIAVAVMARCVMEIRAASIIPGVSVGRAKDFLAAGDVQGLTGFVRSDESFTSLVLRAALTAGQRQNADKAAMREAAELAASEEAAKWFRRIEPLNIIGNLGTLIGLAGTVYGMITAFSALGEAGGQASPAALSSGIAKALFHTLLGLLVALPSLTFFGFYRTIVDRICTRAMVVSSELVEMLPEPGKVKSNA